MYESTKRKMTAMILGVLLFISLCFIIAGWRGPIVILIFALWVAGIALGVYFLSYLSVKNQWAQLAISSCWLGLLTAAISFVLLIIDPRVSHFDLEYDLKASGFVGIVFLVGSFFSAIISWRVIHAFRRSTKGKMNKDTAKSD